MLLTCHNSPGEHDGLYRWCTDHTFAYVQSLGCGSHYCGTYLCVPAGCCSDAPYICAGRKSDGDHLTTAGCCFLDSYIYALFANLPDLWREHISYKRAWANVAKPLKLIHTVVFILHYFESFLGEKFSLPKLKLLTF